MKRAVQLAITVAASFSAVAYAQTWVSTATKALPLANATQLGPLSSTTPVHLVIGLQMQNMAEVQPTLKAMLTPGNSLYGTSLTVDQFLAKFAPTAAQVETVENYLSSYGFKNLQVEPNRLLIQADGTAEEAEVAFNTALATYSLNGKTVFANTMDAQVPSSFSGLVVAVLGLNNILGLHTNMLKATDPCTLPDCPVPAPANDEFTPQDYQIAYNALYPSDASGGHANKNKITPADCMPIGSIAEGDMGCINGKKCPAVGQTDSGTPSDSSTGVLKDLYLYWHNYKLPADPVTVVYAGINSPDTSGAEEWDLDSQTATGISQQVARYYFYVATSLTDSDIATTVHRYASDDKTKLFSISLGECEALPYTDGFMLVGDEAFAEAALQGQTTFASSDDNGSACPVAPTNGVPGSGPPMVSYPASSPYVIAVGATDLFTNADYTYDYELGAEFSGGGISAFETSPFWESTAVPSATAGSRGLPDVAMCGEPNFCGAIIYSGSTSSGTGGTQTCCVGGTSLSSPLAMGAYARIETARDMKLGFAGPLIYQLSSGAAPGPGQTIVGFNDVTAGPNGLYEATPGWDYVTGLGSWDMQALEPLIPTTYSH